jgi:hypothetical protein
MLYHMSNIYIYIYIYITLSIWLLAFILAIIPTSHHKMENESPKPFLLVIGIPPKVRNMHTNLQNLKALGQWNQFTNILNLSPNCKKFKK